MELPGKRELREQILHQMDGRTSYVSDKDVYREIDKAILRSSHGGYGTLSEKEELRRQMFYSIRGFDVLEKYLGDSSISEIMVIGASRIFVEQNGKIRRIEEHFSEEGDVCRLIEQIVAPTNRMVNEACPIVDSRLPDGSRVHIVLPPVSLEGPVITIRKFLKGGMTIEKLLAFEEFPEKLTGILSALVKSRYNILISGATNSGKSSLLNALAEYIGKRERVITIEDSAELQLFHVENLVRLETRNANMEGENEITIQNQIMTMIRQEDIRDDNGEFLKFGTHIFRHCYGKKLTEMHVDDWMIAKLLGHTSIYSVHHYRKIGNKLMADETRAAREKMDMILLDIIEGWDDYEI